MWACDEINHQSFIEKVTNEGQLLQGIFVDWKTETFEYNVHNNKIGLVSVGCVLYLSFHANYDNRVLWRFFLMQGITFPLFKSVISYKIHNYPTKFAERNSLYVHVVPNKRGKRTIRHFGRKLWNIVLDAIDVICSIGSFKLRLKSFLLSSLYKDACQELLKFDVWDESLFFSINIHVYFFFLSITCLCYLVRIICFLFLSNFINCEASKVVICLMVLNMHPAPCDLAPCYWI